MRAEIARFLDVNGMVVSRRPRWLQRAPSRFSGRRSRRRLRRPRRRPEKPPPAAGARRRHRRDGRPAELGVELADRVEPAARPAHHVPRGEAGGGRHLRHLHAPCRGSGRRPRPARRRTPGSAPRWPGSRPGASSRVLKSLRKRLQGLRLGGLLGALGRPAPQRAAEGEHHRPPPRWPRGPPRRRGRRRRRRRPASTSAITIHQIHFAKRPRSR